MSTSDKNPSLPAALSRHAAERPAEPWLFFREGWDWRWSSWEEAARRVEAWSAALASLPGGTRAAFADLPRPRAMAIDLALQAADLIAVPIAGAVLSAELSRRGCQRWVEVEGDAGADAADIELPRFTLPAALQPAGRSGRSPEEAGGAVAVDAAGGVRELTAADLAGAYADIQSGLGAPRGREIV
ncbi:MAG TPA: hypothetical protein VOA87_01870, partial [Thermoanaerobaculia bacterium]|nr:hypothetical protein [Thermoanaerobaculia bacterium]